MGKYSCYSQPQPYSELLGSSRIQISIEKYNEKLLIINYDSYESDPYSKSLVAPHIKIKSLQKVVTQNKIDNYTKLNFDKEYARNNSNIVHKTIMKASLKDNVQLQCPLVFENGLTYWYRNGVKIIQSHSNNKELLIKNIRNEDFGKYICTIHTDSGELITHEYLLIKSGNYSVYFYYKIMIELHFH